MHPAAFLLLTLAVLLALPFMTPLGLAGLALALLVAPGVPVAWGRWLYRSRWLLGCLWLVLAYGQAGEAFADLAWAPTREGMAMANQQALHLALTLGVLAAMLQRLDRAALPSALWALLAPVRALGVPTTRLVLRLALVLDYLAHSAPQRDGWRQLLTLPPPVEEGRAAVRIAALPWQGRDGALLFIGFVLLAVGVIA